MIGRCATQEGQQQLLPNAEIDGAKIEFCPPNNLAIGRAMSPHPIDTSRRTSAKVPQGMP
jgi:hypothetical protein